MPRAIWKGAISFGLVHVPVALHTASAEHDIDFDWIDKRTMDAVGYKRINKRTGQEIASEHIVRGVKVKDGDYVIVGDDEIRAAYPKTTQTIELESFVEPTQIPFTMLERPYYLEPLAKGEKVYALLREAMRAAGVVGIARVVLHTKEHLAVLVPVGAALLLDTLRWSSEIKPWTELKLPPEGVAGARLKAPEMKMAQQLIADMTLPFDGAQYEDRFTASVQALIDERAKAGKTEAVRSLETAPAEAGTGNVVDLTALLKQSLAGKKGGGGKAAPAAGKASPAKKTAPRKRA